MQEIASIVEGLSQNERMRVAAWFVEYASQDIDPQPIEDEAPEEPTPAVFSTFAELYEAVSPKTGAQKVAVAGYWLQTQGSQTSWKASEVNKLLKQINVKISSVSIVLTNAVKAKEPLIEQLARLGNGERSRKTFCLSHAGIAYVEVRL